MSQTESVVVERPTAGSAVLTLLGEHDVSTRDELRDTFASLLAANEIVVANLSEVEFIDSSIAYMLLEVDRAANDQERTFRLQLGTAAIVHRVLEITGVVEQIECHPTREEALAPAKT